MAMAVNGKSIQDLIQEYKYERNPDVQKQLMAQIKEEARLMSTEDRRAMLSQIRESNIAVNGQEPRQDNVYDALMQLHCDLVAESWQGLMVGEIYKMRNGGRSSRDVEENIKASLEEMFTRDPNQFRVFVNAVNARVNNPENQGVEKSQLVLNIENQALSMLQNLVNTFDMQKTNGQNNPTGEGNGTDNPVGEGMDGM